jgi:hypothetical protein
MREIRDLRARVFHLRPYGCTMWESCGLVLINESWRGSKRHFFDVFLAAVVVPLEDGKGLVAANRYSALVVPSCPYLTGDESIVNVFIIYISVRG